MNDDLNRVLSTKRNEIDTRLASLVIGEDWVCNIMG